MAAEYEKSLEKENEKLRLQLAKVEEDYDTLQKAYKLRYGAFTGTEAPTTSNISSNGYSNISISNYDVINTAKIAPNIYLTSADYQVTDKHFKFLVEHCDEIQEFKKAGIWKKIKMLFFTKKT